jgi:hypothetical protein
LQAEKREKIRKTDLFSPPQPDHLRSLARDVIGPLAHDRPALI